MDLEDIFSSKARVKILKLLYMLGSLNVSEIARRLKLNYASTAKHLSILEKENMLQVHIYGRVKMYRLREGTPKTKAVVSLIEAWEQQNNTK